MIISFSVKNFKTFKKKATISGIGSFVFTGFNKAEKEDRNKR